MTITPTGYYFLAIIAISVTLIIGVRRRFAANGEPIGKFATGYLGLIIMVISILFFMGAAFGVKTVYELVSFPKYEATIISFSSAMQEFDRTDSDGDSYTEDVLMHTPMFRFTDSAGQVIEQSGNISSGAEPVIGSTVKIAYHDGELLVVSVAAIGLLIGLAVMLSILGYILTEVFYFTRGRKPQWVSRMGIAVFIIVIFGGMAGMLAGMLYGIYKYFFIPDSDMPLWSLFVCIFFSLVLALTIIGLASTGLKEWRKA